VRAAVPVSRRVFLQASAAAGGGLFLTGIVRADDMAVVASPAANGARDVPLNAWLRITTDDQVTLICSQSEMGQGIMTTLPAVLAEELGADWAGVKVEISPVATVYRNPRINWMFTGNSESTAAFFDLLLQMGASAREMLVAAAAKRWGVPPRECHAEAGKILHPPSARAATFGDLAEAAARESPPEKPTLKAQKDWTLLGRSLPRVELPTKLNGTAVFGMDVRVPGMLYAAVKQSPVFGGQVKTFDKEAVLRKPGVVDVVPIPNGVAVVAKTYWEAARALRQLPVSFDDGPNAALSSESVMARYRAALETGPWLTVRAEGAFEHAARPIAAAGPDDYTAEYESQFLAHATMEPMNCTAHVTADACRIWGPLQGPELAQIAAAQVTGLPQEKVAVERTLLGGGFGRRLLADFVVQAVLVSKAVGAPVKVVWSREEDMQHDVYRPATLQTVTATVDRSGLPRAIAHRLVSPPILQFVFPPAVTDTNDPSCLEGLMESHYEIPNVKLDFHLLKIGVPTSVLRTTGFGPNIFAIESFMDELAHRARQDPYTFRRRMLKDERSLAVLDLAAEKAGWTKPLPPGAGRGIAYAEAFRTHIAHVVELSVRDDRVSVHRIVCVIDCGTALDPEISRSSLEGGTVWGIGVAFKSAISFRDGRTAERNFDGFRIPQIHEAPPIEVYIVDSGARPLGGTGEVGPVTLVPAVTNALFAATGRRFRSLPLSRHGLRLA
jgi:isoquinoline 1-oxidoreductase subunit beta